MKRFITALFLFVLSIAPALADQSAGFFPDPVNNGDPAASYITLGNSAILTSERILSPTARFTITDNGANGTYVLELATVAVGFGGTGATTAQGGFNALANGTAGAGVATGDIFYYNGTNWARLAIGANGEFLTVTAGLPDWATSPAGAPADAEYVVSTANAGLSAEDVLTQGTGISLTNGAGTMTVAIDSTVLTETSTDTVTNKTYQGAIFPWDSGNGFTLKGSANDATFKWADWTGTRDLRVPDPGSTSTTQFLLNRGNQTINGVMTFTGVPVISQITNTGTLTLPTSTDTLVGRATTDTLTNKTHTAPIFTSGTTLTLKQSSADYTVTWQNPAAARAYRIREVATDADFAMVAQGDAHTAGGGVYSDANTLRIVAAGTSGHAFISAGTSAPAWGVLGVAGGGTNITSYTAGDILTVNDAGTLVKLAGGTDGQTLQYDSTGNPNVKWANAGSGTVTSFSATPTDVFGVATATTTPALSLDNQSYHEVLSGPVNNGDSDAEPSMKRLDMTAWFGGASDERPAPTSGTLTGTYYTKDNWSTAGTITCNGCRLYFGGTVTISHNITVGTEQPGAPAMVVGGGAGIAFCGTGQAPGYGPRGSDAGGGGGGGCGGAGGRGGYATGPGAGGQAIPDYELAVSGSGGGGGSRQTTSGGAGGAGGGLFYLEARGNVTIAGVDITADGANGTNGGGGSGDSGGGGGSGGIIDIRSYGSIDLQSLTDLNARGGAGGSGTASTGGGGGGGGGGFINVKCVGTLTDNGTETASGGAGGANGTTASVAGSTGITSLSGNTSVYPRRHF